MAVNEYIEVYRVLIVIAFAVSAINWLGYTILAPWYKYTLGRIVWTKFLANMLVLLVPFLQVMGSKIPFRYEFSILAMILFIIAISAAGVGIYVTQIKGYLKSNKMNRKHDKDNAGVESVSNS